MNGADIDHWKRLVKKSVGFMYKTRYGVNGIHLLTANGKRYLVYKGL